MTLSTQPQNRSQSILRFALANEKLLLIAGALAIVAVMIFHLLTLKIYPVVNGDEPWFLDAPWNWVNNGVMFDHMHTGPLDQFGFEYARRYYLGVIPWALEMKFFGLSIWAGRAVSLIMGGFLLVGVFFAGRRSFSTHTGLLAALLLVLSPTFLLSSHTNRQDIFLTAILVALYWLTHFAIQQEKQWAHFIVGLVLGASIDIHQNGWLFIPAFIVLYLSFYGKKVLRQRGTWLAILGGMIGIAYYVVVFILPNPDVYFKLYSFDFTEATRMPISRLSLSALATSFRDELEMVHIYQQNLHFALIGAGFLYLLHRFNKSDRVLISFVVTTFVVFTLFRASKSEFYGILLYPFLLMIVAETFVSVLRSSMADAQRVFVAALLAMLLVTSGLLILRPVQDNLGYDYDATAEQIQRVIPDDARIMALPSWWMGFTNYEFHSSLTLNYYHFFNDYGLQQGLDAIRPTVIIIDPVLRGALTSDEISGNPYYGLPGQEFAQFLADRGTLVLQFEDKWNGLVEVYQIDWS